jgi:NTP pyrophosphatase (non-canonical NTP hydrolase)
MSLADATASAMELRELFEALEKKRHGRAWSTEQIALGLVGDVGDLAKLIQAAAGVRDAPDLERRLGHELADCLWCVLVLAEKLGVDLDAAFDSTMKELKAGVRRELLDGSQA